MATGHQITLVIRIPQLQLDKVKLENETQQETKNNELLFIFVINLYIFFIICAFLNRLKINPPVNKFKSIDRDKIVQQVRGEFNHKLQQMKKEIDTQIYEEVNDVQLEIYAEVDNVKENNDRKLRKKHKIIGGLQEDVEELYSIVNKQTGNEPPKVMKLFQAMDRRLAKVENVVQKFSENASKLLKKMNQIEMEMKELRKMHNNNISVKQKLNELQEMLEDNSSWNQSNEMYHSMPLNGRKRRRVNKGNGVA